MNRTLDFFDYMGKSVAVLKNEGCKGIPAVNAFHPTLNILVSGNSSGKINVWNETK
jgi:hypothetical protein